jgi:hypothetical protein
MCLLSQQNYLHVAASCLSSHVDAQQCRLAAFGTTMTEPSPALDALASAAAQSPLPSAAARDRPAAQPVAGLPPLGLGRRQRGSVDYARLNSGTAGRRLQNDVDATGREEEEPPARRRRNNGATAAQPVHDNGGGNEQVEDDTQMPPTARYHAFSPDCQVASSSWWWMTLPSFAFPCSIALAAGCRRQSCSN